MAVTLRQLEYFEAVAETGSVTAAARQLYMSQSAVSSSVTELERVLDVKLFARHPRGLVLTAEGRQVLQRSRSLLREAADLELNATRLGEDLTGELSIGCYSTIAPLLLPRVVAGFARRHPRVEVRFAEGSRQELLDGFALGRFDVVVLYDYKFTDDPTDMGQTTSLGALPPYALVPSGHRYADQESVHLPDLAQDPLILFGLEPADRYFLSLFEREGVRPRIHYRTGNYEVLRGLVARGMGYSLLTQRTRQTSSHEGLEYRALELAGDYDPLEVVAVAPSWQKPTRRVEEFVSMAREAF